MRFIINYLWRFAEITREKLSEIPLSLVGSTEYEKVFELAELGNLTREEMCEYNQRLKIERDYFSVMENARDEGREEGVKKVAIKLKNGNHALNFIAEATGLTIEQIESL
ncbi:hypothetical protein FBD94_04570 [Pedobacter hiemivivus]|uniref:Rpn family recombination-promoting nuclease/putative transposase n=1 Tax=Pedobacter hiemivivus TaxID=2530454 RepID=A0A4U1GKY3_9SPHI|nr:hypothetical protein [Pedobacter hiemivivus]TKC63633.1 hypothetical protein FBD94_04570 [Pedobacter hiemivivus]